MDRLLVLSWLVCSVLFGACTEPPQEVAPSASWEAPTTDTGPRTGVFVLVVDAASLERDPDFRTTVHTRLEDWARTLTQDTRRFPQSDTAWHQVDWRMIVVRSRASGPDRFVGPSDLNGLTLQTIDVHEANTLALANTALDVAQTDATEGAFRPIAAINDLVSLLQRVRPPETAREAALLASVAFDQSVALEIGLASLTDDEEAAPIAVPPKGEFFRVSAQGLLPTSSSICLMPPQSGAPRISSWFSSLGPSNPALFWRCHRALVGEDAFFPNTVRYRGEAGVCTSRPVARDADGRPHCEVAVHLYDLARPCDLARGWLDPPTEDGMPTFGADTFGMYRRCNIVELDTNAPICEAEPEPQTATSGVCLLMNEEPTDACAPTEHAIPLRYVGGALSGSGALIVQRCDLEPDPS